MKNKNLNVVVMLGGPGAEREVSLRSGAAVASALRSLGHNVTELDPIEPAWTLPDDTHVVFLALHGMYGEDGTVQRQLNSLGVPYTGCGPEASALSFDKALAKTKFLEAHVPTPRHRLVEDPSVGLPAGFQVPLVIKPARQGSSVGLQFVDEPGQWDAAVTEAFQYDSQILVEERVCGRETTVAVLDGAPLPVVEVRPKYGVYDYHNKYTAGASEYLCPAPLSEEVTRAVQEAALAAYRVMGARDYARVDVMVTDAGQPMVLEVNTLPGMTETSLLPKAALAAGIQYPDLCQKMLDLAMRRAGSKS